MSALNTLIYDRTLDDVSAASNMAARGYAHLTAAEKLLYDAGLKGAYNATDLNRVGMAIIELKDLLETVDIHITVTPKTDWAIEDKPTPTELQKYLSDVAIVRGAVPVYPSTPTVPQSMSGFTYTMANDIERILHDIEQIVANSSKIYNRSGMLQSGQYLMWYAVTG